MRFNKHAAGRPAVAKVQKQYGPDLSQASLREGLAQARDLLFASSYAGRARTSRYSFNEGRKNYDIKAIFEKCFCRKIGGTGVPKLPTKIPI